MFRHHVSNALEDELTSIWGWRLWFS